MPNYALNMGVSL